MRVNVKQGNLLENKFQSRWGSPICCCSHNKSTAVVETDQLSGGAMHCWQLWDYCWVHSFQLSTYGTPLYYY